jgi:hypothetical protein
MRQIGFVEFGAPKLRTFAENADPSQAGKLHR